MSRWATSAIAAIVLAAYSSLCMLVSTHVGRDAPDLRDLRRLYRVQLGVPGHWIPLPQPLGCWRLCAGRCLGRGERCAVCGPQRVDGLPSERLEDPRVICAVLHARVEQAHERALLRSGWGAALIEPREEVRRALVPRVPRAVGSARPVRRRPPRAQAHEVRDPLDASAKGQIHLASYRHLSIFIYVLASLFMSYFS